MKDLKDMLFDELVDEMTWVAIQHIIRGDLRGAIWTICSTTIQWREAQIKKQGVR